MHIMNLRNNVSDNYTKAKMNDIREGKKLYLKNQTLDGEYGDFLKNLLSTKGAEYSSEIHKLIKEQYYAPL